MEEIETEFTIIIVHLFVRVFLYLFLLFVHVKQEIYHP